MRFQAARAGHLGGRLRDRELGPGPAQHARVLREAHRVQRGAAEPGSAHQAAAQEAGIVRVECDAHGWMLGWVYAADTPYYALTAKDGTFTIKDVPPGSYTLVAWQEYTGEAEIPVTVKAKEVVPVTVELKK